MQSLIVEISGFGKHNNADTLNITQIMGGTCIFKAGVFQKGDRAVYIQIDSVLPEDWQSNPRLSFIKERRIKASRLRGVFSMGILIPLLDSEKELPLGHCMDEVLGIVKYEEKMSIISSDMERNPGITPVYKISNYRHHKKTLTIGEQVVVTEKIHGMSSVFPWYEDRLWASSHYGFRKPNKDSIWWQIAEAYHLETMLQELNLPIALYGEVYGHKIQDLTYGAKVDQKNWALFDIYDYKEKSFLSEVAFRGLADYLGLPTAPVLYKGPFDPDLIEPMRNGKSTLANQIREGIVIKPVKERFDNGIENGRVALKLVGEDYLLRKNGTEFH